MSRLLIVVPFLALIAFGFAADVDECRWGESYWCHSLENANTCGAFEHCKSTVWKNQILKEDDSEFCDFCKNFIQDVSKFIKDNRTEQDIKRFMDNACSVIPAKGVATECTKLVDTFLVQILEMIVKDLNPKAICGLIKLCTGFEDTVFHSKLPSAVPVVVQSQPIDKFSPLKIQSEPICGDCKKFFTDIKNLIVSNATEAQVEALIDQTLCAYLGTYESQCKALVKAYLPEVMTLLISEFDPNVVCQSFGFCAATLKEAKTFLINLKLKNSNFYKMVSAGNAQDGCDICKTVMKDVQDLDRNAAVQREIEDFLKVEVCARLGSYKTACEGLVESYGSIAFQLLANELDPESRCRSFGFCVAQNLNRDPTRESTPSKKPVGQKNVADSPECVMCKFIAEQIDNMLKNNVTKQEILDALDKVCTILPDTMKDSCLSFIKEYASAIIDLLIQELDPATVCSYLGMCSSKSKIVPLKVSDATECVVCESVVQYVEALLSENATVAQIEALLQKICSFVPETIKSECDLIVSKYGPFIIQYITTAMTPKAICELVGACQTQMVRPVEMAALAEAKAVKNSYPLLGTIECSWGPKYWCNSRENAKQCKATDYCDQTGWNF